MGGPPGGERAVMEEGLKKTGRAGGVEEWTIGEGLRAVYTEGGVYWLGRVGDKVRANRAERWKGR